MNWLTETGDTPKLLRISGLEDGEDFYVSKISDRHEHNTLINKHVSMRNLLKGQLGDM